MVTILNSWLRYFNVKLVVRRLIERGFKVDVDHRVLDVLVAQDPLDVEDVLGLVVFGCALPLIRHDSRRIR